MPRYKGMGDCYVRHVKELGVTSLWRGNVANCIRYVPTAAFNLAFKDNIKRAFPKYNKNTDFGKFALSQIGAGAAAGGATNTLVYPLIYVRTVLGADIGKVKKFNGMGDCLVKTAREGGILSLYNGIGPSTVGIVVYRGAQFGLQDIVKAFNPWQQEVSARGLISKSADQKMYNGMADCFTKILKTEGPKGFFKGAFANILRGTGAAIVLVMYDEIMNFINKQ